MKHSKTKHPLLHSRLIPLLILLATSGCGPGLYEDYGTATTNDDLFFVNNTWTRTNIPVCWTANGFDAEKALVRSALRGQRSWAGAARLNFTGWGRCGTGDDYAIRITPGDEMVVRGGLGMRNASGRTQSDMELDFRNPIGNWARCTANGLGRNACIQSVALHEFGHSLGFAHEHNRDDTPASCTEASAGSQGDDTFGVWDGQSIMNYCGDRPALSSIDRRGVAHVYGEPFGDAPRGQDFNGDGRDDFLCHDKISGRKWIDYSATGGIYGGTDWTRDSRWCKHDTGELFTGDFDGNGRDDLLCHDVASGKKWIDYANASGRFLGTDWKRDARWCRANDATVLIGDFNGDNRDDLLCHNTTSGTKWIDFATASGRFNGTDWTRAANWCRAARAVVKIGDFNGDGRDDMLCHNYDSGRKWVDYANASGHFLGSNWSTTRNWCSHDTAQLFVGDFNGDGRDDLLCHDAASGHKWVDLANASGQFNGTDWERAAGWCRHATGRLSVLDANGDGRDDILCHDVNSGVKWIDFASILGRFNGTDRYYSRKWCGHASAEFH